MAQTLKVRSKITAIMEIEHCSEDEAKKELERIMQDRQVTGQDIDWTDMGNDELDDEGNDVEDESSEEPTSGGNNR